MAKRSRLAPALLAAIALLAAATAPVRAQYSGARTVSGTVFWDDNANGRRDPGEPGVPGVRLNALHRAAVTGEDGRYSITAGEPIIVVSLSFPSGTWPTAGWFRRVKEGEEAALDFGLRHEEQTLPLVFFHFTDPHGFQLTALAKMLEDRASLPLAPKFYICTGDLRSGSPTVRDVADLKRSYARMARTFEACDLPLFMVPGNHDTVEFTWARRSPLTQQDTEHPLFGNRCWERFVCPSHWSFSCAGVHFVGVEYAQYVAGKWEKFSAGTRRWLTQDLAAIGRGERTVFCAHWPGLGRAVGDLGMTVGLFGDSHTEGRYYEPGSEKPKFPENVLVSGIAQPSTNSRRQNWCQDGRPPGYRIVVVEKDRIDTFYKAFDEPHTIMVNEPRRFAHVDAPAQLRVRGQFFDPRGVVSGVTVEMGGRSSEATVVRRLLWGDFEAVVDTGQLTDGFHELTVTVASSEGTYFLREPYLILTGRRAPFEASGAAMLCTRARRVGRPCAVQVNGRTVGTLRPEDSGKQVSFQVPADLLQRLNRVSLVPTEGDRPELSDVRMHYMGRQFIDQHRIFAWYYDPVLRRGTELYFDLTVPGPAVRWRIQTR